MPDSDELEWYVWSLLVITRRMAKGDFEVNAARWEIPALVLKKQSQFAWLWPEIRNPKRFAEAHLKKQSQFADRWPETLNAKL